MQVGQRSFLEFYGKSAAVRMYLAEAGGKTGFLIKAAKAAGNNARTKYDWKNKCYSFFLSDREIVFCQKALQVLLESGVSAASRFCAAVTGENSDEPGVIFTHKYRKRTAFCGFKFRDPSAEGKQRQGNSMAVFFVSVYENNNRDSMYVPLTNVDLLYLTEKMAAYLNEKFHMEVKSGLSSVRVADSAALDRGDMEEVGEEGVDADFPVDGDEKYGIPFEP